MTDMAQALRELFIEPQESFIQRALEARAAYIRRRDYLARQERKRWERAYIKALRAARLKKFVPIPKIGRPPELEARMLRCTIQNPKWREKCLSKEKFAKVPSQPVAMFLASQSALK